VLGCVPPKRLAFSAWTLYRLQQLIIPQST
jgi:hypothetical protein